MSSLKYYIYMTYDQTNTTTAAQFERYKEVKITCI